MIYLLCLLLPLAALSGWMAKARSGQKPNKQNIPLDYFVGLNHLLNEEPDKAVDIFIKMIEVDSETVETHLALGNLFRRRGEVQRAIRVHQNLIARPQLEKAYRIQAMLELGQDYLSAGVFDRAEELFLDVIDMGEKITPSLKYLLSIYQQEKDWEQAIKTAQKLERNNSSDNMAPVIAHYYCEMAMHALNSGQVDHVHRCIKLALSIDRHCVRASLLQAKIERNNQNYQTAIRYYKRIKTQDIDFVSETIPALIECHQKLDDNVGLINYLRQCLDEHPRSMISLYFTEYLYANQDKQAAKEFLTEQLNKRPSLRGLERLIDLVSDENKESISNSFPVIRHIAKQLTKNKPAYQCQHCGYASKKLVWQCPSCKNWNSVKPIHTLESEL